MYKIFLNLQIACKNYKNFPEKKIHYWLNNMEYLISKNFELTIRLVDLKESNKLNYKYRKKNYPTNILSFQYDIPSDVTNKIIGDLVICIPIIQKEAIKYKKNFESYYAHIIIHGFLHLIGFNHSSNKKNKIMKLMEKKILVDIGL